LVQSDVGVVDPRNVLCGMGIRAARVRLVAHRRNTHWMVDTPARRVVLRRYSSDRTHGDVAYELRLLEHLDGRGWPVPAPVAPLIETVGSIWCAFRYMPGRAPAPRSVAGVRAEQRRRGRLLAQLHADMADMVAIGQREGWRRADEGLFDRTGKLPVDEILARYERESPEEGHVLRAYADRMRERLSELLPHAPAPVVIHGDLTPWNIRFARGTLSAVLDFDAAHLDLRVADFALSWRGRHDEVLRGYEEVSPLEPVERVLLVPIFWAWIIASAVAGIDEGAASAAWAVRLLLRTELIRSCQGPS
jgi:Ser/Thr protein kinase RdoA (MazF antagonist)